MSEEQAKLEQDLPKQGKAGRLFVTLFILLLVGATAAAVFLREHSLVEELLKNDKWISTVVGNFHPIVLHLPIGIVFLIVMTELFGWISFGKWKPVTTFGLFLAVVTGCLACITGLVSMNVGGRAGDNWEQHMWFGIGFVGVLMLAFLFKIWGENANGRGFLYAILLFGAAGVMGYGSHIGGEEIHGKVFPTVNKEAPVKIKKLPQDRLAYAEVIVPILQAKCYDCHEGENDKGDLLMDSWEGLLEGGSEGEALVPGDVENSLMVKYIHLPLDDDLHMPPKKKDQMEKHEIQLLDWWVAALPKGVDKLEDKTLAAMGAPQEIIDAAGNLMTPEERKALKDQQKKERKKRAAADRAKREALEGELNKLKADEQLKNAINYVSQDSTDLEFTAVSLRKSMGDAHLKKLVPVADGLVTLQLGSTSITESALSEVLPTMVNLKKLNLSQTAVTDTSLDAVSKLQNLEWLNLYDTQITDAGLKKLESLGKLKKLYLWGSKATPEGAKALQQKLPGLEILFGVK